jgi:hypothetical protein
LGPHLTYETALAWPEKVARGCFAALRSYRSIWWPAEPTATCREQGRERGEERGEEMRGGRRRASRGEWRGKREERTRAILLAACKHTLSYPSHHWTAFPRPPHLVRIPGVVLHAAHIALDV